MLCVYWSLSPQKSLSFAVGDRRLTFHLKEMLFSQNMIRLFKNLCGLGFSVLQRFSPFYLETLNCFRKYGH